MTSARDNKKKTQYRRHHAPQKSMLQSIEDLRRPSSSSSISTKADNYDLDFKKTSEYQTMRGQMSEYEVRLREQTYKANDLEKEALGLRTRLNRELKRIDENEKHIDRVEKTCQRLQDIKVNHGNTNKSSENHLKRQISSTEKNAKLVRNGLKAVFHNVCDLKESIKRAVDKGQFMKEAAQNVRSDLQESTKNLQDVLDYCQRLTCTSEETIKAMVDTAEIQAAKLGVYRANYERNFRRKEGKGIKDKSDVYPLNQSLDILASTPSDSVWWREWLSEEFSKRNNVDGFLLRDPPDVIMGDSDEEMEIVKKLRPSHGPMEGVEFYDCVRYAPTTTPPPRAPSPEQKYYNQYRSRFPVSKSGNKDTMDWISTDEFNPPCSIRRKLQKNSDCWNCGQCDICQVSQKMEQFGFHRHIDPEAAYQQAAAEKAEKIEFRQEIQQVIRESLPVKDACSGTNTSTQPMIAIGVPGKWSNEAEAVDTVLRAFCEWVWKMVQYYGLTWYTAIGGLVALSAMWPRDDSWLRANEVPASVFAKLQEPTIWESKPIIYLKYKFNEMIDDRAVFG
ncbi:hypothetical protein N7495_003272 [Penicillium taxi]|uniref:uncharacterized protein n=1 Tax=Penicillium taxi TaxID=168475 RepID=UPI002545336D|nr:uncharacterized protein N7495_003272 [Penicillium taxi]KAJ5902744.1 hypothetical protein N7495_003272 [Penicillium taxi]